MSGWTVRCWWYDRDRIEWHYYEKHFDVRSSGEAGVLAGLEIASRSVGSVAVSCLYMLPDSVPRSGWPPMPKEPDGRPG